MLNSGAWQRLVTPEKLEEIMEGHKLSEKDMLLKLTLDDLPDSYSFIIVPKYEKGSKPQARLSYWGKDLQVR